MRDASQLLRSTGTRIADRFVCQRVQHAARRVSRDVAIEHPTNPSRRVTVSMGVSTIMSFGVPSTVAELFELADAALYKAKSEGRDKYIASTRVGDVVQQLAG